MNRQKNILSTIQKALLVIKASQLSDGGFASLSSFDPDDFSKAAGAVEYRTTFFAANILGCLNAAKGIVPPGAGKSPRSLASFEGSDLASAFATIRDNAARFLLAEKGESWSFNYWARGAKERETMPYPDDLDDTFVALAALHGYDATLIDGTVLADVANILIAAEVSPGGPYRTWLVAESMSTDAPAEWRDVDIVVNSNIHYFLLRFGVVLPKVVQFLDERLRGDALGSSYYPGICQSMYFLSRSYGAAAKMQRADILKPARNQLETAMAISAATNLDAISDIVAVQVDALLDSIEREGFRPCAFCIDPSRDGMKSYAGSAALTAAFCVEALAKYSAISELASLRGVDQKQTGQPARPEEILLARTKMVAQARFASLPQRLKELALREVEKIENKEIVMVPYLFNHALGDAGDSPANLLEELAIANVYGWMAYTIYDHFLDGDGDSEGQEESAFDPLLISVANFFLRELTLQYAAIGNEIPGIGDFYRNIMDGIDDANIREQVSCRAEISGGMFAIPRELPYRSLGDLADRSLGHALPAIALLLARGFALDSREIDATISFFKNYLIARQLHDDAHDWQEDLRRGQINSVGAQVLKRWRFDGESFGNGNTTSEHSLYNPDGQLDLAKNMPELQKLFWHSVILDIIAEIKNFLEKAGSELAKLAALKNPEPLEALLERLEAAADRTLREREEAVKFLEAYR